MDTKQKILKVAGHLFSQRGYFGVSMRDIAREVNITKAALYYHFASKEELAQKLLRQSLEELKLELIATLKKSNTPADILFNVIKTLLDFKLTHPEISLLNTLTAGTSEQNQFLKFVVEIRQELIRFLRELVTGVDTSRKLTYQAITILITSIVSFVLSPLSNQKDTHQLAKDLVVLLNSDPDNKK